MHELGITQNILEIACKHGENAHATSVTDIHIVMGQLSSVFDESVQFYWDIISVGTICAGARLQFKKIPAELLCLDCSTSYQIERELTPCPNCTGMKVKIISGEEFFIESIEIQREVTGG